MKTTDLLDLVRIPNVFTAMSDVVAGTAIVAARDPDGLRWTGAGAALLASSAIYMAGMALNDVADAEVDAAERPTRPIPSGRVRKGQAAGVTIFLVLAGLGLAWIAGPSTLFVAAILTVLWMVRVFLRARPAL